MTTHSLLIGYVTWLFGVFGAHRFYYGKPVSGLIWMFTLGLLGIGWLVDLFLIPSMNDEANETFAFGEVDYSTAWVLWLLGGVFGLHRFYMGDILWGVLYLISGGLLGLGLIYDALTLNDQLSRLNVEARRHQLAYGR